REHGRGIMARTQDEENVRRLLQDVAESLAPSTSTLHVARSTRHSHLAPCTLHLAPLSPSSRRASVLRFLEVVEQPSRVSSGERLEPVRLALLDRVIRDRSAETKVLRFPLHLVVPSVLVELTDVHEHAHLRNRLKLRCARLPHVSRERRHRAEV